MYRKSALIGTITCAVLLFASTALPLRAQTEFPLPTELPVQGERPLFLWGKPLWYANDDSGTTWVFSQEKVWSLSLDSLIWKQWPTIQLESFEIQPGYDKANKRFLFWSNGVGNVFTWNPGETTLQRIDKSYHHRTQFGHSWFIHPKTGELYAFGGQGFWTSRGYTTRFNYTTLDWKVLPLDATKPYPSPRATSLSTYDEKRNQFHIFGGNDYRHDGREDLSIDYIDYYDYWVLDVERREWRQQPIYGLHELFGVNKELKHKYVSKFYAVADYDNDLAWYPIRKNDGMYDFNFIAFDYKREFGAYLPISLGDMGIKSHVLWYNFDHKNNHLLIYWVEPTENIGYGYIRVSALPLPHPDSTRAMMDLVRVYGSVHPPAKASGLLTWMLLLLIPAMVAGGWLWQRRSRRPSAEPANDAPEHIATEPAEVTFCLLGQPRLLVNGTEVRNHFSELELAMLFWLHWKHRKGESFQITDEIERVFWHDSPNLDYIRKQRNTTLRRLNEQLTDVFKNVAPGHEWIVDRTSISDKRKREYALDLNGLVVRCDLDTVELGSVESSQLLVSQTGIWVEQIRNDYSILSAAS